MPYISQSDREELFSLVVDLNTAIILGDSMTPGHLNYLFTMMAKAYIKRKGLNYTALNDVVGVFDSAKAEFQRRVVNPYEDKKIEENGDV